MQLILPIYPVNTTLINANVGVYKRDGIVQYLVNGLPVYSHSVDDNASFRFAFGVSEDSVSRALKKYEAKGEAGFFGADARHGKAYKIVGGCRERIQCKLDKGQSVYSIAKEEGVRESAIRYQIKQGYLKKSLH
ncbi:MAG: hypothetical protein MUF75_13405 [Bacteroidia bacterium]|nr:hypothetical protein [Bacteroidia bacterium]